MFRNFFLGYIRAETAILMEARNHLVDFQRVIEITQAMERDIPELDFPYSRPLTRNIKRFGKLKHRPIFLVPGALGRDGIWRNLINILLKNGYENDEIYTIRQPQKKVGLLGQHHSEERLRAVRNRLEEIILYTGATAVDMVCASMGSNDGIIAIQGGIHGDTGLDGVPYDYDLGDPVNVGTFISVGGAYKGWKVPKIYKRFYNEQPICNPLTGIQYGSLVLERMHDRPIPASRIAVLASSSDGVIGEDAVDVARIQTQDLEIIYKNLDHMSIITETSEQQFQFLITEKW